MDHAHMDHSGMDHGNMDHGGMDHGGHGGGGGMTDMCSMNMLFTWDSKNLCIIFKSWHVRGTASLIFSLLAIVAICIGYEALREATRRYETWVNKRQETAPHSYLNSPRTKVIIGDREDGEHVTENTPFLWSGQHQVEVSKRAHIIKALLYAVQCFYAFMMMLLFMTYNGWVMLAVFIGNFVGYVMFGNSTKATKENACH